LTATVHIVYVEKKLPSPSATMKTYVLGTVGDSIMTVKKCAGGHVVTIRVKDDDKKSIELATKRRVFFYFHAVFILF